MSIPPQHTVYYKKARFTSRLPLSHLYTPSHFWLRETDAGVWQIGLTRFATRMLGDLVEYQFDVTPSAEVTEGDTIGWIEGFKAVADVFCAANGQFLESNAALASDPTLMDRDEYDQGWLYAVAGQPDSRSLDAHGYVELLDRSIARILEQEEKRAGEC